MTKLLFLIGTIFGFLAGLIAFLITFNEWQKHQFKGRQLWGEPLRRGLTTWAFFLILSVMLGFVVPLIIQ